MGTILGDGGIRMKGRNARLHIKHSTNQLSYVEYKRRIFGSITSMNIYVFTQKVGKTDYSFAEFVTLTHPVFTFYYRLFYPNSKKIVPKKIIDLLKDPLSLAVWIMDDGSAEFAGVSIQTHSFAKTQVNLLRKAIKHNFEIDSGARRNKGKWIIYFPKRSLPRLRLVLGKHILSEFKYKLTPYSERKKLKTP